MNSVSKVKIAVGYTLLLGVLFFSLFFVHREMEHLMLSDNRDVQWTDSLITLLRKKDANTIYMLRVLSETNDSMVSTREIENIIATRQDSFVTNQRVQQRIITHRDTVVTKPRKKGFFRRLGEVFVPPKKDTAIQVKTSLEYATDTVINVYNPVDSLQEKLRAVAQQQKEHIAIVQRRRRTLQRMDRMLTARIDSLLKGYEQETLQRARKEAEYQQSVRHHSIKTISGIAVGAVLLSVFFLIIIGRDITRSNRYRRELEEARRRAEDLLATREKMMLAITHDFKAPLGSIMGYADLLSRLTVDERQRFYLDNMKTSSEHLLKLVVDLLDFHRLDLHKAEINRVTFHPARLLEEIHVSFEPLTSAKGLELHCDIAPELESTYICDPLRLRQIINNLLSNAVKFTDEGSITMTARYEERRLVVAIADTGKGMEPADRERIFQEFTRLPGAQGKEGFGLGLSIVRMLVQLLEGTIDVDSVPGKGSTFTLRVPLFPVQVSEDTGEKYQETETGISSALSESMPASSQPSLRVLLIDDDRIQMNLTEAMLHNLLDPKERDGNKGVIVKCCEQPEELFSLIRNESFDILFTDIQMPAMNGFELLRAIRELDVPQARTLPVIAITARSDMEDGDFHAQGFAGRLHKPFNQNDLSEILRKVIACNLHTEPSASTTDASGSVSVSDVSRPAYNFAPLTAFSADDEEAASEILTTFAQETTRNYERMQQALDEGDAETLCAVAHKMLPTFTMIEAHKAIQPLKDLEQQRGSQTLTEEMIRKAQTIIDCAKEVVQAIR